MLEIDRQLWTVGGEDDYIELRIALGRLKASLRRAGLPVAMVNKVETYGVDFWRSVEHTNDPEVGMIVGSVVGAKFDRLRDLAVQRLDQPWRLLRNHRAWKSLDARDPEDD